MTFVLLLYLYILYVYKLIIYIFMNYCLYLSLSLCILFLNVWLASDYFVLIHKNGINLFVNIYQNITVCIIIKLKICVSKDAILIKITVNMKIQNWPRQKIWRLSNLMGISYTIFVHFCPFFVVLFCFVMWIHLL